MSQPTALPLRGLRSLAVLFVHPSESLMTPYHQDKAKALGLKYAHAVYTEANGQVSVMTQLVPLVGARVTRSLGHLPMEPDTLLNAVACAIDDYYETTRRMADELALAKQA
jgi:hypothetical protein